VALEFILRGLLLHCCLICYFSSALARDAFSPLCEGCFYSLTTGFVDKLDVTTGGRNIALIKNLLAKSSASSIASKYTVVNGFRCVGTGGLLIARPGVVRTLFMDAALAGRNNLRSTAANSLL
jgi:hypothetical protein